MLTALLIKPWADIRKRRMLKGKCLPQHGALIDKLLALNSLRTERENFLRRLLTTSVSGNKRIL